MFDHVILAAGDFPTHPVPASLLDHPRVVCCDGSVEEFIASGRKPIAVVGDGDSLSEDTKSSVPFVHLKDQETNDLTKAVTWAKEAGLPSPAISSENVANCPSEDVARLGSLASLRLAIIGATGKREDHALGNISLLVDYMHMGLDVQMITDHGVFIPCHGTRTFTLADQWWLPMLDRVGDKQEISIFNFTCTQMRGEGLDFPLRPFTSWWQGTLNYTNAPAFTIHADADYLVFLSFSFRN